MNIKECEKLLLPFHRTVLCHYRVSPDLYCLEEDDMGGCLKTIHDGESEAGHDQPSRPWFQVRFGFRRLKDGRVCVAAFGPDVEKLPDQDRLIWHGHLIENPQFTESDPAFERWAERYLNGSWGVEDGPKSQTEQLVRLIRALTRFKLGIPLLRFHGNPLVNYPVAENTDAYAKAHLELYRLLVDGLDKDALKDLAVRLKSTLKDPARTMSSLKEILPSALIPKIHMPLKKCYDERQKNHGVPDRPASSFPAFDEFHKDLEKIAAGLAELIKWLESTLGADAKACLKRENAMSVFPKFIGPPRPDSKLADLQQARSKTVRDVEFGETENHSEAIVLHFTDGSSIAIQVGSNAGDLATDFEGLRTEDFETDLMVFWAPTVKIAQSENA